MWVSTNCNHAKKVTTHHQNQYPLKKEAAEGIKLVFDSLLRAGVIIPCNDFPYFFPGKKDPKTNKQTKKKRDAGQPTEWRFVQDLKAVNQTVQARAPSVPNLT